MMTSEDSARLAVRSQLMSDIAVHLNTLKGTQAAKAQLVGVNQPRLNELLKQRIDRFSIDALITIAHRLGLEVSVGVRAA